MSEGKYKAQAKWQKANTKRYSVQFYKTSEQEEIEHIEKQPSKQQFFKRLVREDMERAKG